MYTIVVVVVVVTNIPHCDPCMLCSNNSAHHIWCMYIYIYFICIYNAAYIYIHCRYASLKSLTTRYQILLKFLTWEFESYLHYKLSPNHTPKVWESWHYNSCLSQNVDHAEHWYEEGKWLWWQSVIGFVLLFLKEIWSLSRQEVHWKWLGNIYHWLPWLFFEQIMSCVNDKYLYSRYRVFSMDT